MGILGTNLRWSKGSIDEGKAAEAALLRLSGVSFTANDTPVGPKPEQYIHSVDVGPANNSGGGGAGATRVVVMPGYGAGIGFYFKNLGWFRDNFRTTFIDWLGTGISGRPKYQAKTTEDSENFFVESLREWARRTGADREGFVLVGHSLGGYLAATYALKYPDHVKHLVLVGPAAIPNKPEGWEPSVLNPKGKIMVSGMISFFKGLWLSGVTPGSVIRGLGPLGERLVHRYAVGRFRTAGMSDEETERFRDYMYQILAGEGSGEHALKDLLHPFAWGKKPWEDRLASIAVPTTIVYGESDWMRPAAGVVACEKALEALGGKRRAESDLKVYRIPKSGHFPMLDQPTIFHETLQEVLKHYLSPSAARGLAASEASAAAAASAGRVTLPTPSGPVLVDMTPVPGGRPEDKGYDATQGPDVEPIG